MLILTIKARKDFVDIQKNKDNACYTPKLILLTKKTPKKYIEVTAKRRAGEFVRLGLTVTKKLEKTAIGRNRIKRQLREAFKKLNPNLLKNHIDYQIIARKRIIDTEFKCIIKDLEDCLNNKVKEGFPLKRTKKKKSLKAKS